LFLQLIMRKLKRPAHNNAKGGRAGVVVPNGFLFGDGICGRLKEELTQKFNLHTIVRLPNGVFAPYTSIPTNLLFFEGAGPTRDIWYYELPLPEGRKGYTKTQPIQFEAFAECLAWWKKRAEGDRAWKMEFDKIRQDAVARAKPHWAAAEEAEQESKENSKGAREMTAKIQQLQATNGGKKKETTKEIATLEAKRATFWAQESAARDRAKAEKAVGDGIYWPIFNLDRKNPSPKDDFEHLPPEKLADDILQKELRIAQIMQEIKELLGRKP
jgi:type I restriction enzyme M protein